MKDRNVPKVLKTITYTNILTSTLIYVYESWAINSKIKSQSKPTEMAILNLIKRVTQLDQLLKGEIRNKQQADAIL